MTTATFDSNVWRPIVTPARFPADPDIAVSERLNQALRSGALAGFLAETAFTLEQIRKGDRASFLGSYRPAWRITERVGGDPSTESVTVHPGNGLHTGNPPVVAGHLQDALALGIRLLRTPRIAGIVNPDLRKSDFASDAGDATARNERFGDCLSAIETRGAGMAQIVALASKYAPPGEHWMRGIARVPQGEHGLLVKAVAEWADGDAVAAHYAYGNDVFCTHDAGVSAGPGSVLHPGNRAWLSADFGVVFQTPAELNATLNGTLPAT
jgi:hypothetical protein